ncbi:MAG: antibiotic biosynthesis monooxygenase [Gammaproteobacteria bacterium]|nr:antibiotic biosynthesis monooxygenase [Gammaproteobacteria bacterium]
MSKVVLQGYIIAPTVDLPAVLEELPHHIQNTRSEPGCLIFEVTQDKENGNRFDVYEEFASEDDFSLHQERVRNSKWGAITVNVERNYKVTRIDS